MAVIRPNEIRKLSREQKLRRLDEYRKKLFNVRSELAAGGSIQDPSQIREYKKAIARILTIMTEEGEL